MTHGKTHEDGQAPAGAAAGGGADGSRLAGEPSPGGVAGSYGPRVAVAADFESADDLAMTPRLAARYPTEYLYGRKHPDCASYWYAASFRGEYTGEITGFLSREEFDWLAQRLGTPSLTEVSRG